MIDPFDSEFLSQELRESWKKIEELEKENKELRERLKKKEVLLGLFLNCDNKFNNEGWGRE